MTLAVCFVQKNDMIYKKSKIEPIQERNLISVGNIGGSHEAFKTNSMVFCGQKIGSRVSIPLLTGRGNLASFGHAHPRGRVDWRQIAATSEGVSFTHFAKKVSFFYVLF